MVLGTDVNAVSPPPGEIATDAQTLTERVAAITASAAAVAAETLIALVDHTSLKPTDTPHIINAHIDAALAGPFQPAAVCVTPDYAALAVARLDGTGVAVASVAGAFPHGRSLPHIIQQEIIGVLDAGVNEVDVVLDRAAFLGGAKDTVHTQIAWVRHTCDTYTARDGKPRHIKLILETGELGSLEHVRDAAWLALHAGADMVKTSTGTITKGADPVTVLLLCDVVNAFNERHALTRGVKVSGGLSSLADAVTYYAIAHATFNHGALDATHLRFGTSRLLSVLRAKVNA